VASARGHDRTVLRWVIRIVIAGVVIFALIQAIPYGRNHTNPPVQAEPKWDSAQ
jgi:hypothetical protein